jgi:hypothetical protein
MQLSVYESILDGEMSPMSLPSLQIDQANASSEALFQGKFTTKRLQVRLDGLLAGFPQTLNRVARLKSGVVPTRGRFYAEVNQPENKIQRFYFDVIATEEWRLINFVRITFSSLAVTRDEVRYGIEDILSSINRLIIGCSAKKKEPGMANRSNRDASYVYWVLKNSLVVLYLNIQELFKGYLSHYLTVDEFVAMHMEDWVRGLMCIKEVDANWNVVAPMSNGANKTPEPTELRLKKSAVVQYMKVVRDGLSNLKGRKGGMSIISEENFMRLITFIKETMEMNSVPEFTPRIIVTGISSSDIRYMFYLIHLKLKSQGIALEFWVDVMHSAFEAFQGADRETTKKKFSVRPPMYHTDFPVVKK